MTEESLKRELEQVREEIRRYKAERLGGVFICESDAIDETGYGEELVCICRDPDVKPWARCPVHDSPID